ncbi:nitroreductase family protein [Streptococcus mutans]|uniref:nitroreductase family protein n=1 Tax=Streptococcus mutans TaxID=1309 RepID=UPI0002B5A002|nr:nitroreductase family protein [Streptococcus mutans]EMC06741.1 putative NADH dehydrogenase [Streptococcus mutans NLML5]
MNDYLHFLDGRVSVRQFDPVTTLSNDLIREMLAHASYAPSGNNFQPWRVVVVKNKAKQKELKQLSAHQPQVETASVVFLLFGDKEAYDLDWWQEFHLRKNVVTKAEAAVRSERIGQYFALHPEDKGIEGLRLDVGLFAMNLMQVVRAFGYDSVPMRGVDFEAVKTYLKVPNDWEPILMLPVGKALQAGYPHVRKSVEEFAEIIE